jgi:hypothetical protein
VCCESGSKPRVKVQKALRGEEVTGKKMFNTRYTRAQYIITTILGVYFARNIYTVIILYRRQRLHVYRQLSMSRFVRVVPTY